MEQDQKKTTKSVNPFTGETIKEYQYLSDDEINKKLEQSWTAFEKFRKIDPKERSSMLHKLGDVILKNKEKFAKAITAEMGKPIKESTGEVEKCAKHCHYFADNLEEFLKPDVIEADAKESYVIFQPLGVIYHVTPFNFPVWLIFKGVIPAMAMGNTVVNKNPSSCPQCGILAEEAFREAGFGDAFLNIIIDQKSSETVIKNKKVRGVSFTGGTKGGSTIASLAGKYCKKAVMELGGNDPFIVLKDADIDFAVEQGIKARLKNGGQVCTAAKRFIIQDDVYGKFRDTLLEKLKEVKVGDPMDQDTQIGPMAKKGGLEEVIDQVERSKKEGGKVLFGGEQPKDEKLKNGYYYLPTVMEVERGNCILDEETFGPVFTLIKFSSDEDAIKIANDSDYGLAGAIFSADDKKAQELARQVEVGSCYINKMVESGHSLPAGGVKESGFGREGGKYGAHEFVNIKTVFVGNGPENK